MIGIRLFNQEIGKGGAALLKVNELLENGSTEAKLEIFREVEEVTEQAEKYAQIFRTYQKGQLDLQQNEFKRLKNELTFTRQYKSFLIGLAE